MSDEEGRGRADASELPEQHVAGTVVLVVEPTGAGVVSPSLQVLERYAAPDDIGIVVTTTDGVEETVGEFPSLVGDGGSPALGVVDTVSQGQNLTAFHRAVPTVFTPGPADLARVGVAIDNLAAQLSGDGATHLVVRSVTSFFGEGDGPTVVRGIDRTFGRWSDDGIAVLGADFTAVDRETMEALSGLADAVVRVAVTESGEHRLRYDGQPYGERPR